MRPATRAPRFMPILACALALALSGPADAFPAKPRPRISDSTWVDHDGRPIPKPPDGEPDFYATEFREVIVDPISHALDVPDKILLASKPLGVKRFREASDVNAFDEVPNSSWFTNRNHVKPVRVASLAQGPDSTTLPAKPWTIRHPKHGGASAGFQITDAAGRKWLVKLDVRDHPQLSSGADMVARTLLHAAGYNVPHNEPVRFTRADLTISPELLRGEKGERLTPADLDSVLAKGARISDGSYSATASLYLPGHVLGATNLRGRRHGDRNDWYDHRDRRELRGLYVIASWLGFWDTKDANFLDTFAEAKDGSGHVQHYILDPGSSFGADADGVKRRQSGYEGVVDFGWMARRLVTLGFIEEPWRRARQDTGIPSVGRFESDAFHPARFVPEVPDPDYQRMTEGDAYWGAKIVASFSNAQITAAVQAARYEDPRATRFLIESLIQRRDKIARYWFGRVAPLDFFTVDESTLRFHDLATDLGLAGQRRYVVHVDEEPEAGARWDRWVELRTPELPLETLGEGAARAHLELSIQGSRAKPVAVDLERVGASWRAAKIRHG